MKPEKAREKKCPWSFANPNVLFSMECIEGDCMAWEWIDETETLGFCILIEGKDNAL